MEKGYVRIPIERYEELRDFERSAKEADDKVKEILHDLVRFVMNISNSYTHTDDKIHEAADNAGFKIRYEKNSVISVIGKKGPKEYKIKE